jgi:hypothetical protein
MVKGIYDSLLGSVLSKAEFDVSSRYEGYASAYYGENNTRKTAIPTRGPADGSLGLAYWRNVLLKINVGATVFQG